MLKLKKTVVVEKLCMRCMYSSNDANPSIAVFFCYSKTYKLHASYSKVKYKETFKQKTCRIKVTHRCTLSLCNSYQQARRFIFVHQVKQSLLKRGLHTRIEGVWYSYCLHTINCVLMPTYAFCLYQAFPEYN